MAIFIDIKDLGLKNFAYYRRLAYKVAKGDYTMTDLLNAGKPVTDKFMEFSESLRAKYPKAHIALGGDEVRLVIPGVTAREKEAILGEIRSSLQAS